MRHAAAAGGDEGLRKQAGWNGGGAGTGVPALFSFPGRIQTKINLILRCPREARASKDAGRGAGASPFEARRFRAEHLRVRNKREQLSDIRHFSFGMIALMVATRAGGV